MINCYNPLINFIIFCISMLMIGMGMFEALEKGSKKGVIILIIGFCIFVGMVSYLFYLQDYNIPICNK